MKLLKSEVMLWFQYQLSYMVRFHVLVILNEKKSKKKASKKQNFLRETEWLEADASFPCQEDLVKIPHSRFPMDVASLLFSSVEKGSRVHWSIVTRLWALQGQVRNTRIPEPHSSVKAGMCKGNTSWAPTRSDRFVLLLSQCPVHQHSLAKILQGSQFWLQLP